MMKNRGWLIVMHNSCWSCFIMDSLNHWWAMGDNLLVGGSTGLSGSNKSGWNWSFLDVDLRLADAISDW